MDHPEPTPPVLPTPPLAPQGSHNGHQPTPQQQAPVDPGKGLGIAGFVLAFTFTQIIGIILSIIGFVKSKNAGYTNGLALAGIILNGIGLLIFPALMAISIVSYNGISERAKSSQATSAAAMVQKKSELYAAETGAYPISLAQLTSDPTASYYLEPGSVTLTQYAPSKSNGEDTLRVTSCGEGAGVQIAYYDWDTGVRIVSVGDTSTGCTDIWTDRYDAAQ